MKTAKKAVPVAGMKVVEAGGRFSLP
jgi:hypothetical protein